VVGDRRNGLRLEEVLGAALGEQIEAGRIDLERLKIIQRKAKLDEPDILFLKENLPQNMFESFMLDKATKANPGRENSILGEIGAKLRMIGENMPEEDQPDPNLLSNFSSASKEFKALKHSLEQKLRDPIKLNLMVIGRQGIGKTSFVQMFLSFVTSPLTSEISYSAEHSQNRYSDVRGSQPEGTLCTEESRRSHADHQHCGYSWL